VRMEQEQRVADDARRFAEQDASLQRCIADEAKVMAEKATQELAAMEKRAVMAESMLEATLNSESGVGNTHSTRRGLDPLKGNMTKSITRSHSSPSSKQDLNAGWVRRSAPGKVEGAVEVPSNTSDDSSAGARRQSFFGRSFSLSWREKSKLNIERKDNPMDELPCGELLSPVPSSSPKGLEQINGHSKSTANQTPSVMTKDSLWPQSEVGNGREKLIS
jgi:hypothetical protein